MKSGLISVAEAAARKGVSRSAIYKAIAEGRLKAQSVLGKVALKERDVEAWPSAMSAGRPKGSTLSPETRERIAASQRQRWAKRRANRQ